ncbi:hypothetical protein GIB67_019310, partial [Kingdonia uniflora]
MVSTTGCAIGDKVDLVGCLSPVIRVGDEEDIVAELVEWPRLKGYRVEYLMGCSRFREFCKAKSSVDGIWGHAFGYRGNFFRTSSIRQGGDYLYLLPDLAKEKKYRRLGDEVSLELMLPLSNLAKNVMNIIEACPAQLNYNFWEVILICETLNERWVASGSESRITAKDFLEYYTVNFYARISCKVWRKESFIDSVAKESTELEVILKKLGINRFKRVVSKDDKVRRSQAKRRMARKTLGSMEENMLTPELNTPLKLARLNEIPDGPVDMAAVSNTVVRNLAKRKVMKRGVASRSTTSDSVDDSSKRRKVSLPAKSQVVLEESVKITEGADLRPYFVVETGLVEDQCRAKAREKGVTVVKDEFKKLEPEKERKVDALILKEVRAESVAKAERLVFASATSRNNLAGKLYQLRYTKAEILAFSEGNYEEKEIVDEEEVEKMEDGLNVAEKTVAKNQETIDQEIESLRLRVVDLEGLLEVEKNSSTDLQKELDVAREREEQTLLYNTEYAEEYEVLISQYEDQLDDNVKLSLKHEEAKSQVEDKTVTLLSRDLALNQLISELPELKERAASGSRYDAELAEYCIIALKDEISDMKCSIRALNEQLLKREIDLDTARTNLVVSEVNFEKLSSSIVGKELELRNSTQIRDSLIVRKAVQRDKEMNERIDQLCARITELERELRARKIKYEKDLKLELDKRDGKIASGEGSREMKEFLHQKEELVENMRIELINSQQKSINLT